jgi:hypothetical protein
MGVRPSTFVLAISLVCGSAASAAGGRQAELVVRVYDTTSERTASQRALEVAAEILADASTRVRWRVCIRPAGDPGCDDPLATMERTVRMLSSAVVERGTTDGSLGATLIQPGRWLHALVFVDRVDAKAAMTGCDVQLLLGRTIAHEIGHLVLGEASHSREGLMRAAWTDDQLRLSRPADWQFTSIQALTMRDRLTAR